LAFDAEGYTFILLNDVFTAASGVYTKKKLGTEVGHIVATLYVLHLFSLLTCRPGQLRRDKELI
jgi:solute carrier family 35 protein